jgi:hypothetical protein
MEGAYARLNVTNGINCYPWKDGCRRCSLSAFVPWDCLIELRVSGIPITGEFEFQLDDVKVPLRSSTSDAAVAMTRASAGHHYPAVVWRGGPDEPADFKVTVIKFRTPDQLRQEHPELLRVVMKHTVPDKFTLIRRFLISFPVGPDTQVMGIYSVVKEELRRNPRSGPIIKQDFLVWVPVSGKPPIYYSGMGGKGDPLHEHILTLCERFGAPHFGCEKTPRGGWHCGDHWIRANELERRLPVEPEFRAEVERALEQARGEIDGAH